MPPDSFDEITNSAKELKRDQIELADKRSRILNELSKLETEYTEILREAAETEGIRRKELVNRGNVVKQKYEIKKETVNIYAKELSTIILIQAARKLIERYGGDSTDIDNILEDSDVDSEDVIASIWESIEEYNLDTDVVAEAQNELGLDLIDI